MCVAKFLWCYEFGEIAILSGERVRKLRVDKMTENGERTEGLSEVLEG